MVAARQCDHIPVEAMVRVLHRVAVIAFVGATALACGNLATERPDSSFDSGEIRDAGGEDSAADVVDDLLTPCGLKPVRGNFTCCGDGAACQGGCGPAPQLPRSNQCWCGNIPGGCTPPSVCCGAPNGAACMSQQECDWGWGQ